MHSEVRISPHKRREPQGLQLLAFSSVSSHTLSHFPRNAGPSVAQCRTGTSLLRLCCCLLHLGALPSSFLPPYSTLLYFSLFVTTLVKGVKETNPFLSRRLLDCLFNLIHLSYDQSVEARWKHSC